MRVFPHSLVMLVFVFSVTACYTPRGIHTQTMAEPEKPVFDFMVLFVPTDEDIHLLDRQTYDRLLMGSFNDLQYKNFRNYLSDGFRKNFKGTFVHDYQNFFTDHHRYSYDEFISALKHDGVKHILLITLKSEAKNVRPIVTSDVVIPVNYTDRSYQIYLFDIERPTPLWLSYGFPTSTGGIMGVRSTARKLARGTAKELDKGQLLFASSKGRIN